ncbi:MAG: protein kinase, partial [Ktedonobacteraceae bacterium]|nr:protein kinase [Ktedonobacteraceae bacterium]
GDERGILYLVMPFIEGGTLTSYLRRSLPGLGEVAAIYEQLLDAVEYAHEQGLIHRDIKSSNVLLEERRSGPPYVYLADFGLVRTTRQRDNSQAGRPIPLDQVPGTPHYMAPEQTRGIVTPLTDIYALGVLLFQMLTGELPYYDADDVRVIQMHLSAPIPAPSERDTSLPPEMDAVVRRAMAKRPEARYRNVAELRRAFFAALEGPALSPRSVDISAFPDTPSVARASEDFNVLKKEEDISHADSSAIHNLHIEDASEPSGELEEVRADQIATAPRLPARRSIPAALEMPATDLDAPGSERQSAALRGRTLDDTRHGLRITDAIRPSRPPQAALRITEEPAPHDPVLKGGKRTARLRRVNMLLVIAMLVPALLLVLALMPRLLGCSFFPSGFPVFGTPPVATVYITLQSRTLQDKYLLTASPQVKEANLVSHTIPDRLLQQSANSSATVQASGTKQIAGVQARGSVVFFNGGDTAVTVPSGQILTTSAGVRIQIVQSVNVPASRDGGRASAQAIAVQSGTAGNIPAHALDGPCCNNTLTVRNVAPFSGGVDPQTVQIVTQADLESAQKSQVQKLEQQLAQQFQKMLQKDEVIVGSPVYKVTTTADRQAGDQAERVQVSVRVEGSVSAYDRTLATRTASQLLRAQAVQTLDSNYQLQGEITAAAHTVQAGKDGIIYVSVPVQGVWTYTLSPQVEDKWRQSIRGATSAAALAYLSAQPGIATVRVSLPFGTDHVPEGIQDIKIVIVGR